MVFSDNVNKNGIVEQARDLMRVDSTQWATSKIANSCNNWLDKIAGYAIATDKRFSWDDTNQTKLPIGTTSITSSSDYSFLLDEQGNKIITLLRIEYIDSSGKEFKLEELDETLVEESIGLIESGQPTGYYKISDNIIRLNKLPASGTLRFYFQRTPSYFSASDTSKEPGVSPLLHRGFVIASAYDGAMAMGLPSFEAFNLELQREELKMIKYFEGRNNDVTGRMVAGMHSNK